VSPVGAPPGCPVLLTLAAMPSRRRSTPVALATAAGLLLGTLAGCTGDDGRDRQPGTAVTAEEAKALARLLQRNQQRGGADFVATAPYGGQGAVLTLTGAVDYRQAEGRARAVTTTADGEEDRAATIYFTAEELWIGEVDGLAEALTAEGAEGAVFLRRPTTVVPDGTAELVDVLVGVVLNLATVRPDDPADFDGWTWEGQRSIDSRLCALFGIPDGGTVAVAATDALLLQYGTALPGGDVQVTVTLADHGRKQIDLPAEGSSAPAADHAEIAAGLGL
jgi:hypothetical protein